MELCTYNEIKKQKCVIHVIICLNTIFTADKSLMTIEIHGMAQIELLHSSVSSAIYNYICKGLFDVDVQCQQSNIW